MSGSGHDPRNGSAWWTTLPDGGILRLWAIKYGPKYFCSKATELPDGRVQGPTVMEARSLAEALEYLGGSPAAVSALLEALGPAEVERLPESDRKLLGLRS